MRRVMVVLSMVALLVVSAAPALALDGFDLDDGSALLGPGGVIFVGDDDLDGIRFLDEGVRFFDEPFEVGSAAPASQEFSERRITSGPATPSFTVSNSGNNVDLCPSDQQTAQTGQVANEQGVIPSGSETDDIDLTGSSITVTPSETATCDQTLSQSAAA